MGTGKIDALRLRLAVAVLLPRFSLVTDGFAVREIEELERQGQPVLPVPLLREQSAAVDGRAEDRPRQTPSMASFRIIGSPLNGSDEAPRPSI